MVTPLELNPLTGIVVVVVLNRRRGRSRIHSLSDNTAMAAGYWDVILITFVGFVALAALLLVPVWRFLSREEDMADDFTGEVTRSTGGEEPAWLADLSSEQDLSSEDEVPQD